MFEAREAYIYLSLNRMYPVMWFGEWKERWSPSDRQAQEKYAKKNPEHYQLNTSVCSYFMRIILFKKI